MLSLGIDVVVVDVSWVGVTGSPRADLEEGEAASFVRGKLGLPLTTGGGSGGSLGWVSIWKSRFAF